jgi:hypothetical protein
MSNAPSVKITITIDAPAKSNLQKAQIPPDPPGFGPIYRGPIREAPGLHPYAPTRWRDGCAAPPDKPHESVGQVHQPGPL